MKKRPVIESPGDLEIVDQEQDGALGGNPYILKPNFGPKASITKAAMNAANGGLGESKTFQKKYTRRMLTKLPPTLVSNQSKRNLSEKKPIDMNVIQMPYHNPYGVAAEESSYLQSQKSMHKFIESIKIDDFGEAYQLQPRQPQTKVTQSRQITRNTNLRRNNYS